jgi:hypothetical protein
MMTSRTIVSLFVALALCAVVLQAQQPQQTPPGQPLELPEYVVTGTERIDVPGAIKQAPVKPPTLRATTLDTLNALEKQPLPMLVFRDLPTIEQRWQAFPGFVDASIGTFLTPSIDAGYSFSAGGYIIDLRGGLLATSGWANNADMVRWNVGGRSTYLAPEKFLVLGGSTTHAWAEFGGSSYNLYAVPSAPARSQSGIDLGVDVDGAYDGVSYTARASYDVRSLTDVDTSVSDGGFVGAATLGTTWSGFAVNGGLDVALRSFGGSSYPFVDLGVSGEWSADNARVRAEAGFQWFTSTSGQDRPGARIAAEAWYFASPVLSFEAAVRSGLVRHRGSAFLDNNPYLSSRSVIDASYAIVDLRAGMEVHPQDRLRARVGVRMSVMDRDAVWLSADSMTFAPAYLSTTTLSIPLELRWLVTSHDIISGAFTLTSATVQDSASTPYVAPIATDLTYERTWIPKLRTALTFAYVGERYADLNNDITLSAYFTMRLRGTYDLTDVIELMIEGDNLLDQPITVWNGYRERGLFLRAGITWRF